jgi:putative NIF3 family GTP cyclohydrolase 1 type 2
VPLEDLAAQVKETLGASCVQIVGEGKRPVRRVAIACGAAGEFLTDARKASADVFLTGEVRFHDCLAAQAQGISLILPGHYATERYGVEMLAEKLQQQFSGVESWASRREQEPLSVL